MKQLLSITFIALALNTALAQNTTAKYDSTRNFLGRDAYLYIGQELYVKPVDPDLREMGFEGFVKDPNFVEKEISDMGKNAYKQGTGSSGFNTAYDAVAEHYFKVLDAIKDPRAAEDAYMYGKRFYLKMQEEKSGDIVYYHYDTTGRNDFPFIVKGYMEKLKTGAVGKKFVFHNEVFHSSHDMNTGQPITIVTGDKWLCTDVMVDKKWYRLCLVVKNTKGESATISVESVFGRHPTGSVYTEQEADQARTRYGSDFDLILDGKVKSGFTKVMCSLAWGEPDHVNSTTTGAGRTEQWVYKDNHYLYFDEHGKLTTIQ